MAQVTGGSDFDFVWEERVNVSLALLREAADAIAARGSSALQPVLVVESLLAVLFNPLPANSIWGRPQWPVRFFDDKSQLPRSASESLDQLEAPRPRPDSDEVVAALTSVVVSATTSWGLGDPESPNTRIVLQELLDILWRRRLIPRPPGKAYPRGV